MMLTSEGLSFGKITNEIKKELADYITKEGSIKTQDIAFILGYTNASAYLHARKKWQE